MYRTSIQIHNKNRDGFVANPEWWNESYCFEWLAVIYKRIITVYGLLFVAKARLLLLAIFVIHDDRLTFSSTISDFLLLFTRPGNSNVFYTRHFDFARY